MIAFHGTNRDLETVSSGSWITLDPEAAAVFAAHKAGAAGGYPVVIELEIEEEDIDWDVLSALCGVEDERGQLLRDTPVPVLLSSRL